MRSLFIKSMGPIFAINSLNITIITLLRQEIREVNQIREKRVKALFGISNFFNLIFPPLMPTIIIMKIKRVLIIKIIYNNLSSC